MKVLNGNAVSSVNFEKMCGQTNKQTNRITNKQTNKQRQKQYSHRRLVTITRGLLSVTLAFLKRHLQFDVLPSCQIGSLCFQLILRIHLKLQG